MQINKYVAQIRYNGKTYHLGCFDTLEEAKKVREQKELELFGEFSPLKERQKGSFFIKHNERKQK